jgi:UDP-N-acetylglucosamine acyltransferase
MTDNLPRYIHPDAKIGNNVTIEPFTSIYGDVEIGDGTWIGPNVTIFDGARIGTNCKIYPGAVISAVSQDLKYNGEYTTTHIGNNTTIRECVTIHKGTADRYKTVVGSNCLLMAYVHVAHDCIIGDNVIIANSTQLAGHVTIDDWVVIEGMVGIQQFVHIGAHAFIAGSSNVTKKRTAICKSSS